MRLAFVVVLAIVTALPAQQKPDSKPASSPETPAPVRDLLQELDLPGSLDQPGELPEKFASDGISEREIRQNPGKFPLRMRVLETVTALGFARRVVAADLTVPAKIDEDAKKMIRARQEEVATSIAELEDAIAGLKKAAKHREKESPRWQAHYDFALAEAHYRIAMLTEQNYTYAQVIREEMPLLNVAGGETGWQLVPSDRPNKHNRNRFQEAKDQLGKVAEQYPRTPWSKLVEKTTGTPPGLAWKPTKLPGFRD